MRDVKDALERLQPTPEARGDWDAVLRDARVRRPAALVRPFAGVAVAVAALFALALFQPWEGESPTVLERALAAVDDGPVLHVVLRGDWGGTLVDLETAERQPVHGENEFWYDPERGLVHQISRLGGVVQHEHVYEPKEPPKDLVALGREYRDALQSGSARVAGEGVVDGVPVYWITFHRLLLPDVADGKKHEFAQQVAVSRETYEPMALRDMRDGNPGPGTGRRVLELEMLSADEGDFTAPRNDVLGGMAYKEGTEPIELHQADDVLGRTPLWLGREHEGLSLAQVSRRTTATGRQDETLLEGRAAEDALACREHVRRTGVRGGEACDRVRHARQSIVVRDGKVYALGPVKWEEEQAGVSFFYGTLGDDRSTYREDLVPLFEQPHVSVTQTTTRPSRLALPGETYVPPEGSVFVAAGGRTGFLQADGLYVSIGVPIGAPSEELVLSAARSLEPMPG